RPLPGRPPAGAGRSGRAHGGAPAAGAAAQSPAHVHLVRLVLRRDLRHRAGADPPLRGDDAAVPARPRRWPPGARVPAQAGLGAHDFSCALQAWESRAAYERMKDDLLERYARYSLADMVRGIDEYFRGEAFGLPHLFLEERRRVLARVIASVLDKHETTYRGIWEENRKLVRYLRQADAPIPDALAIVARHVLEQEALA